MIVRPHGCWSVTLATVAQIVLLGGCATRVSPAVTADVQAEADLEANLTAFLEAKIQSHIATILEMQAQLKGFGDDLRAATEQITDAQAQAGRDLSQQIQTVSETVTTNGIPWYGLVVVLGILVAGFGGVALLVWMFGYRKGTWRKKEASRDELAGTGGDA